jgi:uncharacterized protein YqeY
MKVLKEITEWAYGKLVKEKDYLRTNTLRLCKKAIKNIEAVERGEFGFGFS